MALFASDALECYRTAAVMAFVKKHDRESFFKYTDAPGARAILGTLTLLWKSPLEFNDPFDMPCSLRFGFSLDELPAKFSARVEQIFPTDEPLAAGMSAKMQFIVKTGRLVRRHGKLDAWLPRFRDALRRGAENIRNDAAAIEAGWPAWLQSMRVFCVSETHDNLSVWAHYAKSHSGAVIELRCIPEKNTALCAAEKVDYQSEYPVLARTADEWIAHVSGDQRIETDKLYLRSLLTKSTEWGQEREWRCALRARPGDDGRTELRTVDAEEIAAVYLGCRMTADDRAAIVKLVREWLPHVQLFEARQSPTQFKLEFERVVP